MGLRDRVEMEQRDIRSDQIETTSSIYAIDPSQRENFTAGIPITVYD